MNKQLTLGVVAAVLIGAGLSASPAQAAYVVTLTQEGPNVVAIGSGRINTTDLTFYYSQNTRAPTFVAPHLADIVTGQFPSVVDVYKGAHAGPTSFGSGYVTGASSGSGTIVGIYNHPDILVVPYDYRSGSPLMDTAIYDNATFKSLGVMPGTYVWKWGSGANADSFTLHAEAAAPPPPKTLLSENFDALTPGTVPSGAKVGPDFTGTNVVIAGPEHNHGNCRPPAASGNCLVLQNALGILTSKMVTLDPGVRYDLSFDLQGNSLTGNTTSSTATVTLGSLFDHVYTLANGSPVASTEVTQVITVPTAETVDLVFKGTGSVSRTAGMLVDNISLTGVATPEPSTVWKWGSGANADSFTLKAAAAVVPEPAPVGLMVLGLLGAGFAGRKRRS